MKRWTFKTLRRAVLSQVFEAQSKRTAFMLAYLIDDDQTCIDHTATVLFELFEAVTKDAVGVTRSWMNAPTGSASHPQTIAFHARDARRIAELLVGIATVLENHAEAVATKQGAGL